MPSKVEADLPDSEPSDSLEPAVEIQDRVSEYDTRLSERIGRYRVERLLGKGEFGLVFLAYDEKLERHVAVKVPHAKLISRPTSVVSHSMTPVVQPPSLLRQSGLGRSA